MQSTNRKNLFILPIAAAISMVFSIAADAASGKFQFVSGEVKIKLASGEIRNATKGMEINEGDMVLSGMPGLAQLKMEDGGTIVVRPNTRFTVQTYRFNGKEDGTERATYKLDQGSVRAITGQIGKTNKQNYLIQTPTASIGVRGTDHEPAYIPKKQDIEYLNAPAGTYDKVNVGETYIETQGGLVVVKPNSVGYAEDEFAVPTILPALPAFYNQFAATGGTTTAGNFNNSLLLGPNSNNNTIFGPDDAASIQKTSTLVRSLTTDTGTNLSARNVAAPLPPVAQLTRADLGVYTQVLDSGFTKIAQTRKLSFGSSNATLAESGSNAGLAVNWGRWENGYTVEGENTTGSLHVVNAARLTSSSELSALPITATYNIVNATRPTDELGRVGDLTKLSANVNFATQKITDYAISATNSGRQWDAKGNGTFGQFLSSNGGLRLNGLCTGCQIDAAGNQITSSANGSAKGAFVGSQAQGVITTYGLQSNDKGISGAAVLQR
jgi:FecR protein